MFLENWVKNEEIKALLRLFMCVMNAENQILDLCHTFHVLLKLHNQFIIQLLFMCYI